ncbi:hypothetical protein [Corallococcus sp. AB032C]|uniref:hypothetical protein n=1 Tax=Corallococcus sp. AB032C TaxID=2316717 RepID=UPI0011C49138|nr:hypothetical protein [Corallococcus sp. AB032C]
MAKTPYSDLKSEDILSAHISGLQHSVNKIEEVLNMKIQNVTGHTLVPVTDQDDPSLRYRIYEGTIRGWLDNPSPVIYRNGAPVDPSEYTISPGHGVVVFHQQQLSTDVITADFTYVIAGSSVLDQILADMAQMQQQITDLQNRPTGGGSAMFHYPGTYRSHSVAGVGDLIEVKDQSGATKIQFVTDVDFTGQKTSKAYSVVNPSYATNILAATNTVEFFPFPVSETTIYDQMAVQVDSNPTGGLVMGVYANEGGKPGALIAQTVATTLSATGWVELPFQSGDLQLEPGLYWLARSNQNGVYFGRCLYAYQAIPLGDFGTPTYNGSGNYPACALRSTGYTYRSNLPAYASSVTVQLLKRNFYCSPWIRRKP